MYIEKSNDSLVPMPSERFALLSETSSPVSDERDNHFNEAFTSLQKRVYQRVFEKIDLERIQNLNPDQLGREMSLLVNRILEEDHLAVNHAERLHLVQDIQDEMLGLGPLEALVQDATVSDILVNSPGKVYVERHGKLELTQIRFHDGEHVMKIIARIVSRVGRRIDESSPMVDARLPDGSRVNAIIAPLALDGPVLSIRRFSRQPLTIDELLKLDTLTLPMAQLLEALVKARINVLISGGTGSGKTTLLNVMSGFIPVQERILTIEDAAELQLQQPHVVRLETRPPNIEGRGEVNQRALVRNALRMRPDRIILGEVRGDEALDMLQAMNTGHEGSFATIHANNPRDAVMRLENMVGMAGPQLGVRAARQQIASAITVVLQLNRLTDGTRRLVSVQEITGMEGDIITMQEIFGLRRLGVAHDGKVRTQFFATGICPQFDHRLKEFGVGVPDSIYDPMQVFE